MSILKNKTCPKCGEHDALTICIRVGAINCSCCMEFIRLLKKEEIIKLKKAKEKYEASLDRLTNFNGNF